MKLVKVKKSLKDYKRINKLYNSAFPTDERAPFRILMRKTRLSMVDFMAIYDDEKWVGLTYVITYNRLSYIFYLAISETERGKGYGKKAMAAILKKYEGNKVFLALETLDPTADNYQERLNRHKFYEQCGLQSLPYKLKEVSVIYDIMGVGGTVEPHEYSDLIERYVGKFLYKFIDMQILNDR